MAAIAETMEPGYVAPVLHETTVPGVGYVHPHPRTWYAPIKDEQ